MIEVEMIKLCAEGMGLVWRIGMLEQYRPIQDDAEAMQLAKRFKLTLTPGNGSWKAEGKDECAENPDLNRAICECVAKIQIRARTDFAIAQNNA